MAIRALLVMAWAAATLVAGPGQSTLKTRFPAPSGYTLSSERDVPQGAEDIQTRPGGIMTPKVAGRIWRATYRRSAGAPATSSLALMRHYRDALHAQGGIRLMGEFILGNGEANFAGRVPGDRPVWLSLAIRGSGSEFSILLVEEPAPTLTEFPVEPEQIEGRWAEAPPLAGDIEDAERQGIEPLVARLRTVLQSTATLKSPRGFQANTDAGVPGGETAVKSGPIAVEVAVVVHEIEQQCGACPSSLKSGLAFSGLTIHVNNPLAFAEKLDLTDAAGQPMYTAGSLRQDSPTTASFDEGTIIMRAGRPPLWTAVSREVYLQARIRKARGETTVKPGMSDADIKLMEALDPSAAKAYRELVATAKTMQPGLSSMVTKPIETELAGLSPEARRAPARDATGRPVIALSTAFFDPALGRGAAQFVVARFTPVTDFHHADVFDRLRQELTSAKLAELFK